ncbi:MAG: hypothetical protein WC974_09440 [Thermoplasmata archaeon]
MKTLKINSHKLINFASLLAIVSALSMEAISLTAIALQGLCVIGALALIKFNNE